MNREFREFQTQSLCGGHILAVQEPSEVKEAEAIGAVGILMPSMTKQQGADYFRDLTVHPFAEEGDIDAFTAAYSDRYEGDGIGYYVLSDGKTQHASERATFITVGSVSEIANATHAGAIALLCPDMGQIRNLHEELREQGNTLPLFYRTSNIESVPEAIAQGANGSVIESLPTEIQMDELIATSLKRPSVVTKEKNTTLVGTLSLQGDYLPQSQFLQIAAKVISDEMRAKIQVALVHTAEEVDQCDGILLPGGWSNLLGKLIVRSGIDQALRKMKEQNKPIVGICASMILCGARPGHDCDNRPQFSLVDATIDNNILNNDLDVEFSDGSQGNETFSNGPKARELGPNAEPIAWIKDEKGNGEYVAVRDGSVSLYSYHKGFHADFVRRCVESAKFDQ